VAISARVHEDIRDRLDTAFSDGGEQTLKNIARPMRVWRWSPSNAAPDQAAETMASENPSIAVLCFDNMSSDPDHEFFADGMAEDIITALSKISRMRVIARNSTFAYKGKAIDLRKVAAELGVRYVLEGSIRSGGSRLRITAQLIDATDGSHVWAERFDRTIEDIFDIQDEITKEIVTALRVKLTDGEEAAVLARGTTNIEAWQLCVRAAELFLRSTPTDYLEARTVAEKAVARDPDYAYAWATLGYTYWWDGRLGYTGDTEAKFAQAAEYAERAMALDDTVAFVVGLATMLAAAQNSHAEGVAIARRGFENNPGDADAREFLAFALVHAGAYDEGIDHFRAAMSLNPFYPLWYRNGLARALIVRGEYDEALVLSDEILRMEPSFVQGWIQKAFIFRQTGRPEDAKKAVREILRLAPNMRLEHIWGLWLLNDEDFMLGFLDGLREAGLPD
jgi:adenylate cyclase